MRKPVFGFPTRSHTNRSVQSQKIARSSKFQIKEVEGLYYMCSENKGADQLRGYREADQRLCFRYTYSTAKLICIFVFAYAKNWFSQDAAKMSSFYC